MKEDRNLLNVYVKPKQDAPSARENTNYGAKAGSI